MNHFLLSHHSLGVFLALLILLIQTIFLIFKKGKTIPTFWLIGVFLSFTIMLLGYFLAYSIYHPIGAFHRYLTVFVLFGNASFVGFSYYFPRNIHERESKYVISISFLIAIFAYLHFVFKTFQMEPIYNFDAHFYTFDFGAQTAIFILLLFLISMVVLVRKTIHFSSYEGIFKKWEVISSFPNFGYRIIYGISRFFIGIIKLYNPIGKDAFHTRTFFIILILLLITAISNILNKNGIISYYAYANYYSNSTLIICFAMLMAYINSSGEPTTFMVKLVGISLVTVLLVLGFISNLTLNLNEEVYNSEKISQVSLIKEKISAKDFKNLPEEILYIVQIPKETDLTFLNRKFKLLFTNDNELNIKQIKKGELNDLKNKTNEIYQKLLKKNKELSEDELFDIAIQEYKNSRPYKNLLESFQDIKNRHYRNTINNNYVYFEQINDENRYEIGYSYYDYRKHTHEEVSKLFALVIITTFLMIVFYPKFFKSSLIKPLNKLLIGVKDVNEGNLDIEVPIKVPDEIGFLAKSFNSMVHSIKQARSELQDYALTLEDKVNIRTREVEEKMKEVHALKVQQDGDYFLTSLLTKPLFINANKSERVKTEFLINQKKKFEFRNKTADLGGDLCITGNLKLGLPDKFRVYTVAMNGDAMGKSMQGAGGSLVMGVVMNSIMARSAANKKILNMSPEQWLTETYIECNNVFKSFNGTMVLSATVMVIDDISGDTFYWNAEHPFSIIYRDGKANFLEEDLQLRKLGLESEYEFKVYKYKLFPGDVLILGSDGRDDIDLTPEETFRTINSDENLILGIVEIAKGDLKKIKEIIETKGNITDDLSFIKIEFLTKDEHIIDNRELEAKQIYEKATLLYRDGKIRESFELLVKDLNYYQFYEKILKLTGLISFKLKEYDYSIRCFGKLFDNQLIEEEELFLLSLSYKRKGLLDEAIEIGLKLDEMNRTNINNLINLADLYKNIDKHEQSQEFFKRGQNIDPLNKDLIRFGKMHNLI
jgi:HAMP domain-containing protein/tetratricopeptide (TPR) repeat protein